MRNAFFVFELVGIAIFLSIAVGLFLGPRLKP
jgi:hypothetical protein